MFKINSFSTPQYRLNSLKNNTQTFGQHKRIQLSQAESDAILNNDIESSALIKNETSEVINRQLQIDKTRNKKMIRVLQETIEACKLDGIEVPKEILKALENLKKEFR